MTGFLDRLAVVLARLLLGLSALLLLIMALHITADVLSRYLFNAPLAATLEIGANYYMVAASFLALGYVQMRDQHVSVDIVMYGAGPRVRAVTEFLSLLISLIYAAAFTWASTATAITKTELGEYTLTQYFNLILWPSRWILVVSGAVLTLVLLAQLLRLVESWRRGEPRDLRDLIGSSMGGV